MLFDLISAVRSADIASVIGLLLSAAVLLLICMPIHECAHAWAANKLGDPTGKYQGRITLNPARHLDLIGAAGMLLFGVGFAKPVPVNMMNFKNRKRDMALVAAAGPISNLLMGAVFAFLTSWVFFCYTKGQLIDAINSYGLSENIYAQYGVAYNDFVKALILGVYKISPYLLPLLTTTASINISLAAFNLIPVPPFDGSRILGLILPDRIYYKIMQYEQIIFYVVLALLITGIASGPISAFIDFVYTLVYKFVSIPVSLLA